MTDGKLILDIWKIIYCWSSCFIDANAQNFQSTSITFSICIWAAKQSICVQYILFLHLLGFYENRRLVKMFKKNFQTYCLFYWKKLKTYNYINFLKCGIHLHEFHFDKPFTLILISCEHHLHIVHLKIHLLLDLLQNITHSTK